MSAFEYVTTGMTDNVDKLDQTEQSSVFKNEINKIRAANIIFALPNENRRFSCAVRRYFKQLPALDRSI